MKKLVILTLLCVLGITLFAQDQQQDQSAVAISGGLVAPLWIVSENEELTKIGYHLGLSVQFDGVLPKGIIEPGLRYVYLHKSWSEKFNDVYTYEWSFSQSQIEGFLRIIEEEPVIERLRPS